MKKQSKKGKGFTLTELVIVIVIIAILAAVLIPAYTGYVQKAKRSIDNQLVYNLNMALFNYEGGDSDKQCTTIQEAIKVLNDQDFQIANLSCKATGCSLLWNETTNRFYILYEEEINDASSAIIETTNAQNFPVPEGVADSTYWEISSNLSEKYSTYLTAIPSNAGTDAKTGGSIITVSKGVDTSAVEGITIIQFVINDETDTNTYKVFTDSLGTTLNVISKNATVQHYGRIGIVNVINANNYVENGKVELLEVAGGNNVTIDTNATVKEVLLDDATTCSITNNGSVDEFYVVTNNDKTAGQPMTIDGITYTQIVSAAAILNTIEEKVVAEAKVNAIPEIKIENNDDVTVKDNGNGTYTLTGISGTDAETPLKLPKSVTAIQAGIFSKQETRVGTIIYDHDISVVNASAENAPFAGLYCDTIYICDGITNIPAYQFYNVTSSLVNLIIPDSVVSIGEYAFSGSDFVYNTRSDAYAGYYFYSPQAADIRSVYFEGNEANSNRTLKIGQFAFHNCTLESITFGDNLNVEIGDYAFSDCAFAKTLTFGDNCSITCESNIFQNAIITSTDEGNKIINEVDRYNTTRKSDEKPIFIAGCPVTDEYGPIEYNQTNFETITFGDNCSINSDAMHLFANMTHLTTLDLGGINKLYEDMFMGCTSLESVVIPGSVISMDCYVFENCSNLKKVVFEESEKNLEIPSCCFVDCASELTLDCRNRNIDLQECDPVISSKTTILVSEKGSDIDQDAFKDEDDLLTVWFTGTEAEYKDLESQKIIYIDENIYHYEKNIIIQIQKNN